MIPAAHTRPPIAQIAPRGHRRRISTDSAWPLRCADGRTFAERKQQEEAKHGH